MLFGYPLFVQGSAVIYCYCSSICFDNYFFFWNFFAFYFNEKIEKKEEEIFELSGFQQSNCNPFFPYGKNPKRSVWSPFDFQVLQRSDICKLGSSFVEIHMHTRKRLMHT